MRTGRGVDCLCVLQYILNDKEVQVKTELWIKQNAEYLKEQKGQEDSSSSSSNLYLQNFYRTREASVAECDYLSSSASQRVLIHQLSVSDLCLQRKKRGYKKRKNKGRIKRR